MFLTPNPSNKKKHTHQNLNNFPPTLTLLYILDPKLSRGLVLILTKIELCHTRL